MATLATDRAAVNAHRNMINAINNGDHAVGTIAVTAAVTFDDGKTVLAEYDIPRWTVSDTEDSTLEGWILDSNNGAFQVFAKRHGVRWQMMESAEVISVEL